MDPLIPTGQPAPDFTLADLNGNPHRLLDYRGRVVVLNFWSAECPWAARADRASAELAATWGAAVVWLSVASNANEPPELLSKVAAARNLKLVLHDPDQRVADLYGAQTTPHFFLVDPHGILQYQGAFDDVNFRQREPTRAYLRQAVKALLAGDQPDPGQTPPYGCILVRFT